MVGGVTMPEDSELGLARWWDEVSRDAPDKEPRAEWLKLERLPPLVGSDGRALPREGVVALLALQAKEKRMAPADAVAALRPHIDRASGGAFAQALLQQWLASAQAAVDRWVLCIAGLLGDERCVEMLSTALQPWCQAGRGKLAEYAVQAIALNGTDAALVAIERAATQFATRFRNVGAAARAAFAVAAADRGVDEDELADTVVPDLGFDSDRRRRLLWDGGEATALLGNDGKLQWEVASGKRQRSLPASAPATVKAAARDLAKEIRAVLKTQSARLEAALVRQRRWDAARWPVRFVEHPLLRTFGERLVFSTYDGRGERLGTLRVLPDGLLADARGDLVELGSPVATLGIVHPLELDAATLAAWREQLARCDVTQPFAQLDRAVERLDPGHRNRRQLTLVEGKELLGGTFRGRAERRGWVRGSVVDAGLVSAYWKRFPTAGVDVLLPLEGLSVSGGHDMPVTLGTALFVRSGTVTTGSYVYDEPNDSADPRVLAFGDVPAIVWSETVGDLRAIAGT